MSNLIFIFMLNLSFHPSPHVHKPCSSGFKNYVEKTDASGHSVLVECPNPYEGLSADSFSLQAQIDAGVPMQHLGPVSSGSLSSIDKNNREAEFFVGKLSKPQVPQVEGN